MKEGMVVDKIFTEKDGRKVGVTIRFPTMGDTRKVMIHRNRIVREGAFVGATKNVTLKYQKESLKELIRNIRERKGLSLLAESHGKIVGMAGGELGRGARNHVIDAGITVSKEYRRMGIGKKMMKTLMRLAKEELKAEIMTLSAYRVNRAALEMYRRMGFRKFGRIKSGLKLHGNYYDEVHMVKKL